MMAQRVRKFVLAFFSMVILCLAPVSNAFATTPTFGHVYQNGVGNVSAWLNTASGVGYWSTYITGGANNWMYPGWSNPIYINFVSSNYGSTMDFHLNYSSYFLGGYNTLAQTKFFNSSGVEISPTSANWAYAEIHINDDAYRNPGFTNAQAQGTTIHEMGHAFGLAHDQGNPYSIMCQTAAGRIVQSVQKVDNDAINILY
jgi:hypothetical protein